MDEKTLKVTAYGQGARGPNNYGFNLDLHSSIDSEVMLLVVLSLCIYVKFFYHNINVISVIVITKFCCCFNIKFLRIN